MRSLEQFIQTVKGQNNFFIKFIYSEKATTFCKMFTLFCPMYCQSKIRGRFRKILWPSQNIMTVFFYLFSKVSHFYSRLQNKHGQKKTLTNKNKQTNKKRISKIKELKLIYSEKATKFCGIFTLLLTGTR